MGVPSALVCSTSRSGGAVMLGAVVSWATSVPLEPTMVTGVPWSVPEGLIIWTSHVSPREAAEGIVAWTVPIWTVPVRAGAMSVSQATSTVPGGISPEVWSLSLMSGEGSAGSGTNVTVPTPGAAPVGEMVQLNIKVVS